MTLNASEQRYSRPDVPRDDRPIRVGSLLFTLVQPRPGHEVAFNRWYERDHFYAGCMIGAHQFAGSRYVATRDCKALRYGTDNPGDIDRTSGAYLAVYWVLDGAHDDWNRWGVDQVNNLHAGQRMFAERDHIHTGLYRYLAEYNAPGSSMPVELALDRHYGGVIAALGQLAPSVTNDDVRAFHAGRPCPSDVMLLADPVPMLADRPGDVPASEGVHVLQLFFSIEDPRSVWDRYRTLGADFAAAGLGTISFASPFLSTIPGTDTYTDQL